MRDAVYDKICLCGILLGTAFVAVGVSSGALSTPSLLLRTEEPRGIIWVLVGLWIVAGSVFALTCDIRARLWIALSPFALPGFMGASHMAMQKESMFWIALGFGIFTVAAALSMLIRPKGTTLRVPLAIIGLSLAVATFAHTRPVPAHPNPIPAHMMPAERPE
jgi:hypothetical protein